MRISTQLVILVGALFMASAWGQQSLIDPSRGAQSPSSGSSSQDLRSAGQPAGLGTLGSDAGGAFPSLQNLGNPLSTAITNRSRLGGGGTSDRQEFNADLERGLQELQARQLQQQILQLQYEPKERIEFQDFLLQSTGKELPVFGANLFNNVPSTFAPVGDAPVSSDYVLGPSDEIIIRAWGQIELDMVSVVDRNGAINIPKLGVVQVAGVKVGELSNYLRTIFSRNFRNFELAASLGKLRSIQVFAVGQARKPGTYTVSSMSTLVNAVFSAGGPSSKGSMRSVQLRRNNKIVADLDLYDLLISGDKSRDVQLLSGDVIYFSPIGPLVAITGSVNVPAIYELKQGIPLFDLIRWAGGLSTTAAGQKAIVERIEDRKARKVQEFTLDATGLSKPIQDGDLVTVYSIAPRFDNAISLRGSVAQPGRFPWREGMRIRDIIPNKEALLSRNYLIQRNQIVGLDGNISRILQQQGVSGTQLTIEDLNQKRKLENDPNGTIGDTIRRLQVESEAIKFLDPRPGSNSVQLSRQRDAARVQEPTTEDQVKIDAQKNEALRLINQIRPPQGEVNWNYAVIERLNQNDLSTSLLPFNLGKAIDGDPLQNLNLQPGDIVTIFSKDDLQVPLASQTKFVRLEGELAQAGVYQVAPSETLRQLVTRIGGVTQNAYLFGTQFTRESTRVEQQKNLDEAISRLERDIQRFNIFRAQNLTTAEDAASLGQQAENQRQLIARLRQVRATGRIVLEVPEDGKIKDLPDLPLENGDRIYVPAPPSMVSVLGAVYSQNSFIYKTDKRVTDYLEQAGGPTKDADPGSIYVLRADGSVISRRQSGLLAGLFSSNLGGRRLMPGDSIVVPEEVDRTSVMRNLKDIAQLFYQFGLGAAALKVLRD